MRKLKVNVDEDSITPEILLPLQLRTANEPFLPSLENFGCENTSGAFIPFIPLFLSPQTTEISIVFDEESPTMAVASIISMIPSLCPNLERVTMKNLERNGHLGSCTMT